MKQTNRQVFEAAEWEIFKGWNGNPALKQIGIRVCKVNNDQCTNIKGWNVKPGSEADWHTCMPKKYGSADTAPDRSKSCTDCTFTLISGSKNLADCNGIVSEKL